MSHSLQPAVNIGTPINLYPSLAVRRWIFAIYAVAWTVALEMPVPIEMPTDPTYREPLFTFTKCLHVSAYALLTILAAWMRLPGWQRAIVLVLIIAHTMLTELGQFFLSDICHRTGQWSDVGLDLIGITIGFVLSWKWWLK
jgi:VanZ family protein